MGELVVLLPAYNEEKNVDRMIRSWLKGTKKIFDRHNLVLKVVVVDDGSNDKTCDIVNDIIVKYDSVELVKHPHNKGLGAAVMTGMKHIDDTYPDCKYICVMDCDNTQPPKYVLSMLRKIEQEDSLDIIIASRYRRGSGITGVAWYRQLTSVGARFVYSLFLHIPNVRDYTCGYRLYSADIIRRAFKIFGDAFINETGFTCMAEILYKLHLIGGRCGEVPFQLLYDQKEGASKMKVLKTAINSFKIAIKLSMTRVPEQ